MTDNKHTNAAFDPGRRNRLLRKEAATGGYGFALIIALVLMAFMMLLLLSLSSLVVTDVAVGSAQSDAERARKNALLGLTVALGELQTTLGPDQRVNAPASLASDAADKRKNWTGVYKSWDSGTASRPATPEFVRWLVSGDAEVLAIRNTAVQGDIGATYSDLIRGDDPVKIEAGLVAVGDNTDSGTFAWWVGDENAKARLRYDSGREENLANWMQRLQGGAGADPGGLSYVKDIDWSDARLSDLLPRASLQLLGAEAGKAEQLLQSLTPYSFGLLTNVRKGGLRKDLSFYLEASDANRPRDPLYTLSDRNNVVREGVHFGELWAHYNIWRQMEMATGRPHPDGGTLPSDIPILKGSATASVERASPFGFYNRPLILMGGWMVSVQSAPFEGGTPTQRQMQVVADPVLLLWNPYDVSLDVPHQANMRVRFTGLPYSVEIFADGVSLNPGGKSFVQSDGKGLLPNSSMYMQVGNQSSAPLRLRPGEVLFYSLAGASGNTVTPSGTEINITVELGWNRNGGIVSDLGDAVDEDTPISVAMTANSSRALGSDWLFAIEETMGGGGGRVAGGFHFDRLGWGQNSMVPSDFPDLFSAVPVIDLGLASELDRSTTGGAAGKFPIAFFSVGFRTEEGISPPSRFLTRATRAAGGVDLQDLSDESLASQGVDIRMHRLTSVNDNPGFDVFNGKGFFGGSYEASSGNSQIITQSVPRVPIYSLAAFQHAPAGGLHAMQWSGDINAGFHTRKIEPAVAKIIGNSHALPVLSPSAITGTINDGHPAIDHSYHANMALWDDWFFSSIAPRESAVHRKEGINQQQLAVFDAFASDAQALPNPHMTRYRGVDTQVLRDKLFDGSGNPKADAHQFAAGLLMVEGMFNVNSTDVDAWVAVLSALRSDAVAVSDSGGGISWESASARVPLPSLLVPFEEALADADLSDTAKAKQWLGYRDFSDAQIRELAEAVVAEVKKRGPFLSIADFVNRRVGSDKALAKSGALQTALDAVANSELMAGSRGVGSGDMPSGLPFPEAEAGARATGSPAYVDQADVLTIIGSGLNVRSDTFLIRSYGDVRNAAGEPVATARCEAVVQRIPDYMDASEESHLAYDDLNEINQRFGRQFRIITFRWLDEDEI